jgi:hypothetical protein
MLTVMIMGLMMVTVLSYQFFACVDINIFFLNASVPLEILSVVEALSETIGINCAQDIP